MVKNITALLSLLVSLTAGFAAPSAFAAPLSLKHLLLGSGGRMGNVSYASYPSYPSYPSSPFQVVVHFPAAEGKLFLANTAEELDIQCPAGSQICETIYAVVANEDRRNERAHRVCRWYGGSQSLKNQFETATVAIPLGTESRLMMFEDDFTLSPFTGVFQTSGKVVPSYFTRIECAHYR